MLDSEIATEFEGVVFTGGPIVVNDVPMPRVFGNLDDMFSALNPQRDLKLRWLGNTAEDARRPDGWTPLNWDEVAELASIDD